MTSWSQIFYFSAQSAVNSVNPCGFHWRLFRLVLHYIFYLSQHFLSLYSFKEALSLFLGLLFKSWFKVFVK